MVGYNVHKHQLTHIDYVFAGAASGVITRGTCQPLDVLKIRFQLQVEPICKSSTSKYRSILQAVHLIIREEGFTSLWKGHVPAQLLSIVYGMTQFWCYEMLTKKANFGALETVNKPLVNFTCGALSGCAATAMSFPFDVVRTRLVAQNEHNRLYSGVLDAFTKICKQEGSLVLFRGILPTFIQVAPHAGVQFMAYAFFNNFYRKVLKLDEAQFTFFGSVFAGGLAGLCAKTAIYPLDLTKKRMQIQGIHENRKSFGKVFACRGMLECLRKTYEYEGFLGLFKGLSPSLLKAVLTSAIHFSTYELTLKIIQGTRT